ncbi:MAG: type II toxin-antitoxin system Phd/YefM family antitoxin [Candidatus Handelsmanbacteria bacterium]|nr:type II toxin-antitoxin system Phd/YefM family antitoxin [Candidatus Handelsmanbacteria bacterium]
MRFVSVRELRGKSAAIWKTLAAEKDLVVTSNGKPIAVLSATSEDTLEESLVAVRRARALAAVTAMQQTSVKAGTDRLSKKEIEAEIAAVRKGRAR